MARTPLNRLPLKDRETGDLTVVIETPCGNRNKYTYDPSCDAIRLRAVLAEGLAFPYDFGFFPSTLGDDGDPLDVLLLLDTDAPPGCVATARLIGVIVEQKEKGGRWERNDRFVAVATHAHTHRMYLIVFFLLRAMLRRQVGESAHRTFSCLFCWLRYQAMVSLLSTSPFQKVRCLSRRYCSGAMSPSGFSTNFRHLPGW